MNQQARKACAHVVQPRIWKLLSVGGGGGKQPGTGAPLWRPQCRPGTSATSSSAPSTAPRTCAPRHVSPGLHRRAPSN